MIIQDSLKSNNDDFDMSHVIDKETLKAYPKDKFSQKDYDNALTFFNKALLIRKEKNDSELIESTNIAIKAIERIKNESQKLDKSI